MPVTQPHKPNNKINAFFVISHTRILDKFHLVTISIIGGNINANAVLLKAPISDINNDRYGIASAKTTEKQKKNAIIN